MEDAAPADQIKELTPDVAEKEITPMPKKKKVVRKKKVAKKRPGRPPGSKNKKKTAKRGPGRPPGRPTKKKAAGRPRKVAKKAVGHPRKKVTRKVATKRSMIELPINAQTDIDFWSSLVNYLNTNQGKDVFIQLDGKTFALGVG